MAAEVKLFDCLEAVTEDAAGMLDRAATLSLFDRLAWFRLTLAHCPPPGRLLVARAAEGQARAWLFLAEDKGAARALASWYTLDFGAIVQRADPAQERTLLAALATKLRSAPPRLGRIELAPLSRPAALEAALRQAGWLVRPNAATTNWRVRVAGVTFDEYWAHRPGRLRETVRRHAARAALETVVYRCFDATAWAEYEQVYAASWKPEEGSRAFLRDLAVTEGAAGTLRLGIARKDGIAVAAQLWLVENGTATIHKLAHVEAARVLSPGTLLSAAMFRHVIDGDTPEWIDFGTGDDAYKADWMDERRTLYRIEAFNPASLAGLAAAAHTGLGSLARRLRSD